MDIRLNCHTNVELALDRIWIST